MSAAVNQAASIDEGDPVSHSLNVVNEMGRNENRLPLFAGELRDELQELTANDDIQTTGGFVQNQQVRVVGKSEDQADLSVQAAGEVLLFFDADASTPIEEIQKILPLIEQGADVVIGSRSLPNSDVQVRQPWYREAMGRVFNLFVHLIVLDGFVDTQCGFKAFRRKAAREIFALQRMSGFSFDVELLVIARILGYTVRETPVVWVNSPMSRVHPVWDSLRMLVELIKIRGNRIMGRYGRKGLSQ